MLLWGDHNLSYISMVQFILLKGTDRHFLSTSITHKVLEVGAGE